MKPDFVTIPAGAMIETSDDLTERGLHHVVFDGKDTLPITRDIRERPQKLKKGRDTLGFEGGQPPNAIFPA